MDTTRLLPKIEWLFAFGVCLALNGCHIGSYVLPLRAERGSSTRTEACEPLAVQGANVARPYGRTHISTALRAVVAEGGPAAPAVALDSAAYSAPGLAFEAPMISTEAGRVYVASRLVGMVDKADVRSTPITLRVHWTPEGSGAGCVASFALRPER